MLDRTVQIRGQNLISESGTRFVKYPSAMCIPLTCCRQYNTPDMDLIATLHLCCCYGYPMQDVMMCEGRGGRNQSIVDWSGWANKKVVAFVTNKCRHRQPQYNHPRSSASSGVQQQTALRGRMMANNNDNPSTAIHERGRYGISLDDPPFKCAMNMKFIRSSS